MTVLALWAYLALAAFVLGSLVKAVRYLTMPMHVRWELYPVAHETGKRASYGGSYYEEVDWWTKPQHSSKIGEFRTIAEEVLTLKQVREHNPGLWPSSLAFHYGLYLLFALGGALVVGAVLRLLEVDALAFLAGSRLLSIWGAVGLALATLGGLGLLIRRSVRADLRRASTPADFVNLVLLLAVFAASWVTWATVDRSYTEAANFVLGLASLDPAKAYPAAFVVQVALLGVFLAYLPLSHMTHMFTKYFTWHSVRWDDAPNTDGKVFAARTEKLLARPVSWSAPHIKGDGRKTWAQVATEKPEA